MTTRKAATIRADVKSRMNMLCVVAHGEGWVVTKSSDGRLFRYVLRGEVSKKKSQATDPQLKQSLKVLSLRSSAKDPELKILSESS